MGTVQRDSTTDMTEKEMALTRKWIDAWKLAGPELERQRRQEIREADTSLSIPAFDGLFEAAIRDFPPEPTSGLVEQQRCFQLARK
jgi:hypothetical protein